MYTHEIKKKWIFLFLKIASVPKSYKGIKGIQTWFESYSRDQKPKKRTIDLIKRRRQEFSKERLRAVDEGAYRTFQLDQAILMRDVALDAVLDEEGIPSTSFEKTVNKAKRASVHLVNTLRTSKRSLERKFNKVDISSEDKKASMKKERKKNRVKSAARKARTAISAKIIIEHSYVALI